MFQPLAIESTAEVIAHRLEALILEGVLRPRDRLPAERELAEELGVSREALRAALKRLEAKGLVTARQGDGTYVADVIGPLFQPALAALVGAHPRALADYFEFRRSVESLLAMLAAQRATAADREILSRIVADMAEPDLSDATEAALDVELHLAIAEAAHNLVYLHVARSCYRLLEEGMAVSRRALYGRPEAREALLSQHQALVAAILAGDPAAAGAASDAHLAYVETAVAEAERSAERARIADLRLARRRPPAGRAASARTPSARRNAS